MAENHAQTTLRGLIFANTYFREVKKSTIREYLFSRISRFKIFREYLISRIVLLEIFREYVFSQIGVFDTFTNAYFCEFEGLAK